MTAVLVVEDLWAGYDDVAVVRGLSIEVNAGEVVALLGPNGAGKTTTLLTVSGLLAPLRGVVDVLGEGPPSSRRPHRVARRGLAHVPEDRALFHQLTVRENLVLAGGGRGSDWSGVLGWFPELEPLVGRRVGLLSGGEQQMVALGRALISQPRLLLVDEMSLGLAPMIVERLLPVLRRAAHETGLGVLLVEQHVQQALTVADRAVVLNHGQVVATGQADDLRANQHLLESTYMGSSSW